MNSSIWHVGAVTHPDSMRPTYVKRGRSWRAAVKVGHVTVWACEHYHTNRDQTTKWSGTSAMECARSMVLDAVRGFIAFIRFSVIVVLTQSRP